MTKKGKSGKHSKTVSASPTTPTSNTPNSTSFGENRPIQNITIAINIGSHSCTVAFYNSLDQKVIIVPNPDGFYATPTTITPIETDHGTIDTVGRVWYTSENQKTMFFGSTDKKDEPQVENMIKFMIHIAEDYTGKVVNQILLVTPVEYTSEQIAFLEKIISKNLNLRLLQSVCEPLAACMAYEFDKTSSASSTTTTTTTENAKNSTTEESNNNNDDESANKQELILVLDHGFNTSTASLVIRQVSTGLLTLLHTEKSDAIGGYQIDQCVLEYIISEIKKKYFNNRLSPDQQAILSNPKSRVVRKLKECIETAKSTLSNPNVNKTNISVESLIDGVDVNIDLFRARFEMAAERVLNHAPVLIDKCLEGAKRRKLIPYSVTANNGQIDRVLLIGSTSKVIKLKQIILKHLGIAEEDKVKCLDSIEYAPTVGGSMQSNLILEEEREEEEAMAKKKARKAKSSQGKNKKGGNKNQQQQQQQKDKKQFNDLQIPCIPLSISLNTHGDGLSCLFPRYTTVPCEKEITISNAFDQQQYMLVRVVQGERLLASQNKEIALYVLELTDKSATGERGELECKLLFSVDEEGEFSIEIDEPDEESDKQPSPKFVLHNVMIASKQELTEQPDEDNGEYDASSMDNEDDDDEDDDDDNNNGFTFDKKKLELTEKHVSEELEKAINEHNADVDAFTNRDARMKLENYCYKCRKTLREQYAGDQEKIQSINDYVSNTINWINENTNLTKNQYLVKLHEFHAWYQQLIKK